MRTSDYVFIISRGRADNVPKLLNAWAAHGFNVVFVVDPSESNDYIRAVGSYATSCPTISIMSPEDDNLGLGYARKFAVEHADSIGLNSFIMSDDDIKPKSGTDAALLCQTAARAACIAVGARVPYHDFAYQPKTGGKLADLNRVVLCPSGMAFRFFGVNVSNAMDLNFDPLLTCQNEDSEFMRQWIARGVPWLLDTRVEATSIGARYTPGGVRSFLGDAKADEVDSHAWVKQCHTLVKSRWPDFVNAPTEPKIRTRWAKMYDHYIPNWRDFSAIHGGRLEWDGSRSVG